MGRIYEYATTHTEDSVYIIGGRNDPRYRISTIAKYKDDIWTIAGNLKQKRAGHGAITIKGRIMIIGGGPYTTNTEIWDFNSNTTEIINQTLSGSYRWGMGLFPVDVGYC